MATVNITYNKLRQTLEEIYGKKAESLVDLIEKIYEEGNFKFHRDGRQRTSQTRISRYVNACLNLGIVNENGRFTQLGLDLYQHLDDETGFQNRLKHLLVQREDVKAIVDALLATVIPVEEEITDKLEERGHAGISSTTITSFLNLLSACGVVERVTQATYFITAPLDYIPPRELPDDEDAYEELLPYTPEMDGQMSSEVVDAAISVRPYALDTIPVEHLPPSITIPEASPQEQVLAVLKQKTVTADGLMDVLFDTLKQRELEYAIIKLYYAGKITISEAAPNELWLTLKPFIDSRSESGLPMTMSVDELQLTLRIQQDAIYDIIDKYPNFVRLATGSRRKKDGNDLFSLDRLWKPTAEVRLHV